jgi:hypothetical protein
VPKRRKVIAGLLTFTVGGTAGCLSILDNDENNKNNTKDKIEDIPDERILLGSDKQLNIRILKPDIEYRKIGRTYIYEGNRYTFEEFGSKISMEFLEKEVRSHLSQESVVEDNNIFVTTGDIDLLSVNNPEIRSRFEVDRFRQETIVVEYLVRTSENSIINEPRFEVSELLEYIPHSAYIRIQFDQRVYESVIPIVVKVIID